MGVVLQTLSGFPSDSPAGCPLIGWHNLVTTGNASSSTADASFPIANLANPATHLKWKGTYNTGDEILTFTVNADVSYVAVAKHNWGTLGVPVSVEYSTSNSPSDFIQLIAPQVMADDQPIIFRFQQVTAAQVRIKIAVTDASAASAFPEAAVVYVGRLLVLERSITMKGHTPITYGRQTNVVSGMSESGNFLGRIVLGESRTSKAEFEWFTSAFYRQNEGVDDFLAAAQETPFFWAWSPDEYPLETGYVWLTNDAMPEVDPATRRVGLTLEMKGVA